MDRLTDQNLDTFNRCRICNTVYDDICELSMWIECDDQDKPEPGKIIMVCKKAKCLEVLRDHPRLYQEVPWGLGAPGWFVVLCNDCSQREESRCKDPRAKCNGGEGILIHLQYPFGKQTIVCYHENDSDFLKCRHLFPAACDCQGFLPRSKSCAV